MAHEINLKDAELKLPELLKEAISGEEVIIFQGKTPLVRFVPHKKKHKRTIGSAKGEVIIKKGFKNIPNDFKEYFS